MITSLGPGELTFGFELDVGVELAAGEGARLGDGAGDAPTVALARGVTLVGDETAAVG